MIKYSLKCHQGHIFESWFQSSDTFDALATGKHLSCPVCGSPQVTRSLMAPSVTPSRTADTSPHDRQNKAPIEKSNTDVQGHSEDVGTKFAQKAREMYLGDAPERPIHGIANPQEAKSLIEDGIPIVPFAPRSKAN